jgi:hypothetical protein
MPQCLEPRAACSNRGGVAGARCKGRGPASCTTRPDARRPLCSATGNPICQTRISMPVQENHGSTYGFRQSAKVIDVATVKRARLASFLHVGTR